MKLHTFLTLLTLTIFSLPAHAEGTAAPPPAPVGQPTLTQDTPPPAPPAPAASAPAPVARKEETEVNIRSGFFSSLFPAKGSITPGQAADEITRLRAENDDLRRQLTDAQSELKAIAEDWPAIRDALTAGKADAPALQTDLGKKVAAVTMHTAAAQVHAATGHDPKKLPGPGSAKPDTGKPHAETDGKPLDRRQLAAATREYWAARGAHWLPGNN